MGLPFRAIENPYFRKFCELLNPSYKLASRNTLRDAIIAEGASLHARTVHTLKVCENRARFLKVREN